MRVVRSALILVACLSATATAHERRPSIYSALHRCPLKALATGDNDIRLDMDPRPQGRKVPLPASVAEVIYRAASKDLASLESQDSDIVDAAISDCIDTFGKVYRLTVPGGRQIFVARVTEPTAADIFHLVLFDPANRKIDTKPLWLSAKWTEEFGFDNDLAKPPVFRFEQAPAGRTQLVFSEYQHNGNVYNAIIDRYFELGADLSIRQVMALEKMSSEPGSENLVVRRAREIARGRIDVSVYERPKKGPDRKLGSYRLVRGQAGQPYRVVERSVIASAHDGFETLVDGCHGFDEGDEAQSADDKFQRVGCDFYY